MNNKTKRVKAATHSLSTRITKDRMIAVRQYQQDIIDVCDAYAWLNDVWPRIRALLTAERHHLHHLKIDSMLFFSIGSFFVVVDQTRLCLYSC